MYTYVNSVGKLIIGIDDFHWYQSGIVGNIGIIGISLGPLDFVLRALRALRPCDQRISGGSFRFRDRWGYPGRYGEGEEEGLVLDYSSSWMMTFLLTVISEAAIFTQSSQFVFL